eukprot:3705145-Heterocapsa_arctica.AAC.1
MCIRDRFKASTTQDRTEAAHSMVASTSAARAGGDELAGAFNDEGKGAAHIPDVKDLLPEDLSAAEEGGD